MACKLRFGRLVVNGLIVNPNIPAGILTSVGVRASPQPTITVGRNTTAELPVALLRLALSGCRQPKQHAALRTVFSAGGLCLLSQIYFEKIFKTFYTVLQKYETAFHVTISLIFERYVFVYSLIILW